MPDTSVQNVLTGFRGDHGSDFRDKAQADAVRIVVVFGGIRDLRENGLDIKVKRSVVFNMDRFDLIFLGNRSSATKRDHLKPTNNFILVDKSLFDCGLESGALVDFSCRVKKPTNSQDILSLYRSAIQTVLFLLHPSDEVLMEELWLLIAPESDLHVDKTTSDFPWSLMKEGV